MTSMFFVTLPFIDFRKRALRIKMPCRKDFCGAPLWDITTKDFTGWNLAQMEIFFSPWETLSLIYIGTGAGLIIYGIGLSTSGQKINPC